MEPITNTQTLVNNFLRLLNNPHFEEGKSIITPGSVVISGNDAVIFANFQHTVVSTGRTFQTPVALHLSVERDKIIGLHLYEDTWVVSNAFFGSKENR